MSFFDGLSDMTSNAAAAVPMSVPNAVADSAPTGGMATPNSAALLDQINQQNKTALGLASAASVPIAGGHAMTLPSAMTRPIAPFQPQQLDHSQKVGARAAKGQGIANLIRTAGNVVGQAITQEKQQKQAQTVDAATKLMTALQLNDEAQQQYDSAAAMQKNATGAEAEQLTKTMEQAKANIDKNDKVIQGITSDPKMRKTLAKGLNINYIDPAENKTEQHAVVKRAIQNVQGWHQKREAAEKARQEYQATANPQGAKNFTQAFAASQPQGLAQNQIAQQRYATVMSNLKDLHELYKAVLPKEIEASSQMARTALETNGRLLVQNMKDLQDDKNNASAQHMAEYTKNAQLALERVRQQDPIKALEVFQTSQTAFQNAEDALTKTKEALAVQLAKTTDAAGKAEVRASMRDIDAKSTLLQQSHDGQLKMFATALGVKIDDPMLQVPTVHVGDGVSDATGSGTGNNSDSGAAKADLDPTTRKPWHHGTPAYDKLFIKGAAEAGSLISAGKRALDSANQSYRKLQRALDPDKNKTN